MGNDHNICYHAASMMTPHTPYSITILIMRSLSWAQTQCRGSMLLKIGIIDNNRIHRTITGSITFRQIFTLYVLISHKLTQQTYSHSISITLCPYPILLSVPSVHCAQQTPIQKSSKYEGVSSSLDMLYSLSLNLSLSLTPSSSS